MTTVNRQRSGIPVDAFGGATIDPTKNVLDLVEAANRRQDDLRAALDARVYTEIAALKTLFKEMVCERDKWHEQRHATTMKALEAGLSGLKGEMQSQILAQKEAVTKAEMSNEKRFEGVNEFRAQLGDQQRTLMPRVEAEKSLNTLADKIGVLEGFRTEQLSRGSGAKEGYGWAVGVVGLIVGILAILSFVMRSAVAP